MVQQENIINKMSPNDLVYVIQEGFSKPYSYRGPYFVLTELYKNVFCYMN